MRISVLFASSAPRLRFDVPAGGKPKAAPVIEVAVEATVETMVESIVRLSRPSEAERHESFPAKEIAAVAAISDAEIGRQPGSDPWGSKCNDWRPLPNPSVE